MKYAYNQEGALFYAQDGLNLIVQDYFCPHCGQAVYLKSSRLGNYFFAHYYPCQVNSKVMNKQRHQGESMSHQLFKEKVVKYFDRSIVEVMTEHHFPVTGQFADVVLGYCQNYWILEYQQSPISSSTLRRRHHLYQDQVKEVYWLFREHYFLTPPLGQWAKNNLQFHPACGLFFLTWDEVHSQLFIRPQLSLIIERERLLYRREKLSLVYLLDLDQADLKFKDSDISRIFPLDINYSEDRVRYKINHYRSCRQYYDVLNQLYAWGLHLSQIPSWMFVLPVDILVIHRPSWCLFAIFYGFLFSMKDEMIDVNALVGDFRPIFVKFFGSLDSMAFINFDLYPSLIHELIDIFNNAQLITRENSKVKIKKLSES